jgi:hypothetical protein
MWDSWRYYLSVDRFKGILSAIGRRLRLVKILKPPLAFAHGPALCEDLPVSPTHVVCVHMYRYIYM